ncbi:MAG: hypothetical protein ABIT36_12815 [Steroidobacteraceae bacterium]
MKRTVVTAAVATALLAMSAAQSAQYFWEPSAEVIAEGYTNRDLLPDNSKSSSSSYGITAGGLLGIATPRSTTSIAPAARYQKYPDRNDASDLEGGVEFLSGFRTQRSRFEVSGSLQRRDVYNAELANPRFSDLNPSDPTAPTTGRIQGVGETRDAFIVRPRYSHAFTERFDLAVQAGYEKYKYSSDVVTALRDYDYWTAGLYPSWALSRRTSLTGSIYAGRYAITDDSIKTDTTGASIGIKRELAQTFTFEISAVVERTQTDRLLQLSPAGAARFTESDSSVGGRFSLYRKGQVSDARIDISHLVSPTGAGGLYETDMAQLQYDRRLSPRLTLRSAAIYYSTSAVSAFDAAGESDYINAELSLRWNVTPAWYVFGGYRYVSQDDNGANGSVDNHTAFAGLGYKALSRRQ